MLQGAAKESRNSMLAACWALSFVLTAFSAGAAEPSFNLTIVGKDGEVKNLTYARLRIVSSRGYMVGQSCQWLESVDVTDPVLPPAGVQIKTRPVNWSDLSRIDWLDVKFQGMQEFALARLTHVDGKTSEVFLFFDQTQYLTPLRFCISGRMQIGGKDYEVTIDEDFKSLIINR